MNLYTLLAAHADADPDHPFLEQGDECMTYAEGEAAARRVSAALAAAGVAAGDRVAILARSRWEHMLLIFGSWHLGAVPVSLNFRLSEPELRDLLAEVEPSLLVATPELLTSNPSLAAGEPARRLLELVPGRFVDALPAPSTADPAPVAPEDLAMLVFTSGTTSARSRAAMISHGALRGMVEPAAAVGEMTAGDRVLLSVPLFNMAGTAWSMMTVFAGGTLILPENPAPRALAEELVRSRANFTVAVPTIIRMLLDAIAQGAPRPKLRLLMYAAAPATPDLILRCRQVLDCRLVQVYASTEAGIMTALTPEDHWSIDPGRLRSAGRPLPGVEVCLRDVVTDQLVDRGPGEIWIRTPAQFTGYWRQPEETAKKLVNGWLRTGDLGTLDADGYLTIMDRLADVIRTGGQPVSAVEVEDVLRRIPGIRELAVVGVPDEKWGETVKAVVVAAPGADVSEPGIIAYARDRLGHYKCPTSVDFVEALPRDGQGKLLKRLVREPYWKGFERRVN